MLLSLLAVLCVLAVLGTCYLYDSNAYTRDYASIAAEAVRHGTGARGLRSICERVLLDTMFELPGSTGVSEVVVTPECVSEGAQPTMVHANSEGKRSPSRGKSTMSKEKSGASKSRAAVQKGKART